MENGKIVIDKIKFMDKQGRIKIDFKNDGGNDEDKCFTEGTAKKLWALEKEARRYLDGERAQTNLFDGEQQPKETTDAPALEEDVKMVEA